MYKQFSPNMLKTFELCPRKFYFKYEKNISMPVNNDIFELGKNIHAIASYYLRNDNIEIMEQALSEKEKEIWNYLKGIKYFSYDVINTEYSLMVKISENYFSGRLDALVKDNQNYYILDYKTGSVPHNAKYEFQTMIYLLAVKDFFKTNNISFVYLDLKNKSETKINYTPELGEEYSKKLTETAAKINNMENSQKKNNCSCEYSIVCY